MSLENNAFNEWQSVPDTAQMNVLTWGSHIYESTYWSPLKKALKGDNPGHGAFTLELPHTAENKLLYEKLLIAGYPTEVVKVPIVEQKTINGHTQYRNKKNKETGKTDTQTKYIIRFSPYFYTFADIETEAYFQKHSTRKQEWDTEIFHKLKDTQIVTNDDIQKHFPNLKTIPLETSKHIDNPVDFCDFISQFNPDFYNQYKQKIIDHLNNTKSLDAQQKAHLSSKIDKIDNIEDLKTEFKKTTPKLGGDIIGNIFKKAAHDLSDKKIEEIFKKAYTRNFKEKYEVLLTDRYAHEKKPEKAVNNHIKKMVNTALHNRKYSDFYKKTGKKNEPSQIIHLDRMLETDLHKEIINESANMIYASYGTPPDRIDTIPFKTKEFGFGLDLNKVANEMLNIKYKSNEKIFQFIEQLDQTKLPKELQKDKRENIISKFIEYASDKGIKIDKNADIKTMFEAYTELHEKLLDNTKKPKELTAFLKLWSDFYEIAYENDFLIQDASMTFTFNCCKATKDCIRAGLDNPYKGYLSEPFLIPNSLTTPAELAQESQNVGAAISSDKKKRIIQAQTQGKKTENIEYNTPPLGSRVTGFFKRIRNNNFFFLPSRTVIRPLAITTDYAMKLASLPVKAAISVGKATSSLFSKKKEKSKKLSKAEESISVLDTSKDNIELLKKYLYFQKNTTPFLVNAETYNNILNDIKNMSEEEIKTFKDANNCPFSSTLQLEIAFKCQFDLVSTAAFKYINDSIRQSEAKSVEPNSGEVPHNTTKKKLITIYQDSLPNKKKAEPKLSNENRDNHKKNHIKKR